MMVFDDEQSWGSRGRRGRRRKRRREEEERKKRKREEREEKRRKARGGALELKRMRVGGAWNCHYRELSVIVSCEYSASVLYYRLLQARVAESLYFQKRVDAMAAWT